jgi:hypothetical protein
VASCLNALCWLGVVNDGNGLAAAVRRIAAGIRKH